MKIVLKKIELKNFKGIKDLEVEFGKLTNISGENGLGKSTIMDSFMWLLFGKDSKDRKDYKIKTIGADGEELHGLEHSVLATLEIDEVPLELKRVYKEKWSKQRGQAEKELKGHTTDFYINDVPSSLKEFNEKVNNILADSTFKLITNPYYFTSLEWKKQREILLEIIGDIDTENVLAYNKDLKPLENLLDGNLNIEELRAKAKAKIKKVKDDIKAIPNRIDECNSMIIEEDFDSFEKQKFQLKNSLKDIEVQIADKSKGNEEKIKVQDYLYQLKEEYNKRVRSAERVANEPLNNLTREIKDREHKLVNLSYEKQNFNSIIKNSSNGIKASESIVLEIKKEQENLRNLIKEKRSELFEFDENSKICKFCNRELEESKITELVNKARERFESDKKAYLDKVISKGKALGKDVEKELEKINVFEKRIEESRSSIERIESKISTLSEEKDNLEDKLEKLNIGDITFEGKEQLEAEIKDEEERLQAFKLIDYTSELRIKKSAILNDIEEIDRLLYRKERNAELKERIVELEASEKELSRLQAELEGQEFLCESFIRTKVELLEETINKKFNGLSFKLFDNQINGGLAETCEALVNGVPFSTTNTAAQINAGLQIINTLCEHYKVSAPVFIDNAESVNKLVECNSQIIRLVVSKDKKLKVEVVE